jgi:hypothetical protein
MPIHHGEYDYSIGDSVQELVVGMALRPEESFELQIFILTTISCSPTPSPSAVYPGRPHPIQQRWPGVERAHYPSRLRLGVSKSDAETA